MTKNLLLSILYFLGSIIIINILITIFNYFNILNDSIIRILKFLMVILSISITSYILGKKSSKKGTGKRVHTEGQSGVRILPVSYR